MATSPMEDMIAKYFDEITPPVQTKYSSCKVCGERPSKFLNNILLHAARHEREAKG